MSKGQTCINTCENILNRIDSQYFNEGLKEVIIAKDSIRDITVFCDSSFIYYYNALVWVSYTAQSLSEFNIQREATREMNNIFSRIIFKDSIEAFDYYQDLIIRTANYYRTVDYDKASYYYKILSDSIKKQSKYNYETHNTLYNCYRGLGILETKKNNHNKAINYYKHAIDIETLRAKEKGRKPNNITMNCLLGDAYKGINKMNLASKYFEPCTGKYLDFISKNPLNKVKIFEKYFFGDFISNIDVDIKIKKFDRVHILLEALEKIKNEDSPELINIYLSYSKYYHALDNITLRQSYLSKIETIFSQKKVNDIYHLKFNIFKAQIYRDEKKYQQGVDFIDTSLVAIPTNEENYSYIIKLKILKINLLYELKDKENCLNNIANLIKDVQPQIMQDVIFEDYISMINNYHPVVEKGLEIIYTDFPHKTSLAFDLIEFMKSIKLFKEHFFSSVNNQANDSLIINYKILVNNIAQLELKQLRGDTSISKRKELFELKERKIITQSDIKNQSNKGALNYINITFEEFVSSATPTSVYFLFLEGQKDYYYLKITKNKSELVQLTKIDLDPIIDKYVNQIQEPHSLKLFFDTSKELNKKLSIDINLAKEKHLIISTDGKMAHIPFEALVDKNGNFLIQKHTIRYTPSAKIDYFLKQKGNTTNSNLEVAIFQPNTRNEGVSFLNFSEKEVQNIIEISNGDLFIDDDFLKDSFVVNANKYNIIHLVTHAQADSTNDDLSYIYFGNNTNLFFNEIPHLSLNTELISLSTCESGKGKNYIGEGVQSLSRNFLSAGSNSVISTLWSSTDLTISEIMTSFYKNMFNGNDKTIALAKAKRSYLKEHQGKYLHPYYWAGIILVGRENPIVSEINYTFSIMIGLVIIFLFLWVYKKLKGV